MVDHITCPPYGPYNFSSLSVSLKSFFLLSSLKPNPKHHGRALRAQTPSPTLSHSKGRIPAPRSRLLLEPLLIVLICDDTTTNNGCCSSLSLSLSLLFLFSFYFLFSFFFFFYVYFLFGDLDLGIESPFGLKENGLLLGMAESPSFRNKM